MDGAGIVLSVRLEALKRAIEERDWQQVEWQYDRVRSAAEKAMAGGAPRGANGRPT